MVAATPIRAAALAGLVSLAACLSLAQGGAGAAELNAGEPPTQTIAVAASDFGSRAVALGTGKSVVIDFPRDIKDVLVANPKIANAVIRSARRAYVIGNDVGQTNVFFFDAEGRQMVGLDIAVTRNLNGIRTAIKQILPDSDIRVEGIGEGVILTGIVSSQAEAQQAFDIATRLLGVGSAATVSTGDKVVNAIVVRGRDQIMLKVTVAEVERDLIKQLGINLVGLARLRHRRGQFQQHQSVHRLRPIAQRLQHQRRLEIDHRHVAGHGAGRRHPHARRAEPDRHLGRNRDVPGRRRVSDPERLFLLRDVEYARCADHLPAVDRVQEVRRQSQLHPGRAQRRSHQPARS